MGVVYRGSANVCGVRPGNRRPIGTCSGEIFLGNVCGLGNLGRCAEGWNRLMITARLKWIGS